ncbi:MAG: alpha-hydroxy-acid oxidizing protein [Acidimicrobiaceae bacterium]|nr:alpha-hydroxy-acid oxidizing protein [Acidimicrobiaceae bacterium]
MPHLLSIEDYHKAAKRRLPRVVYDYVAGGAETEFTVAENRRAFEAVTLRPRGGMDPAGVDIRTTVLGTELSMPILLAPCGMSRIVHVGGDLAGAKAASKAGTIFVQSTMSGHPVEEVVAGANGFPVWYQVYRIGPQAWAQRAIERARDAGVAALVITFDTSGGSMRERDRRSGGMAMLGTINPRLAPKAAKLALHPRWLAGRIRDGLYPHLANVIEDDGSTRILGRGSGGPSGLTWQDLTWVRRVWSGPIVIKGLQTPGDALRAIDEGAAAVVVSNHGGRQLDTAEATLRSLPEIVDAVGDRCEVMMDGGVRSGTDVLKALSLGARAVLVGRPWLYGLAVGGEAGVDAVIRTLSDGVRRNMVLLGAKKVTELDRTYVRVPPDWLSDPAPAPAY